MKGVLTQMYEDGMDLRLICGCRAFLQRYCERLTAAYRIKERDLRLNLFHIYVR